MHCIVSGLRAPSSPLSALASALLAVGAFAAAPAVAGEMSPWSAPSGTAVRLMSGERADGVLTGGIEIRLTPGWKTYWRYPGDAGIPPRFDWSGSGNVARVDIAWPAPVRFEDGGSTSIGYKTDVILPFRVTPKDASKPVDLRLNLDFAVCEKICQPASAALNLDVPAGDIGPAPAALADAQRLVPAASALGAPGAIGIDSAAVTTENGERVIRVVARVGDAAKADLFVEGPSEDWALPLPARESGTDEPSPDGRAVFVLPVDGVPKGADIATAALHLTLVDGTSAVEVETPLSAR